jgi:hypothetical protein
MAAAASARSGARRAEAAGVKACDARRGETRRRRRPQRAQGLPTAALVR